MATKMPPRDQKLVQKLKDLFQKGLEEAAEDPEKLMYIQRHQNQMVKPWEDYMKDWTPPKTKASNLTEKVARRFLAK